MIPHCTRVRLLAVSLALGLTMATAGCRNKETTKAVPPLTRADLLGTWVGDESFGSRFTITRSADGTFTESIDTRRASVPANPRRIEAKGRWSLEGDKYTVTYTSRSDDPILLGRKLEFTLEPKSQTEFQYRESEANWIVERKQ